MVASLLIAAFLLYSKTAFAHTFLNMSDNDEAPRSGMITGMPVVLTVLRPKSWRG